jgi:hypothetical protein
MDETTNKKQSVGGFKVLGYSVKKSKDTEKVRLVLEAVVDDIACGDCDMGDVLKALLDHQVGEVAVGLSVFVEK